MAFFCIKSGARIVAPGIAISAGGSVPDFDDSATIHAEAENAARAVLSSAAAKKDEGAPSPELIAAASKAAETVLTNPKQSPKGNR
jgi:hypothetical protein